MENVQQIEAFSYVSEKTGRVYYLHKKLVPSGAVFYYFSRAVKEGWLGALPDGFEVGELQNGVPYLKKVE